MKVLSIILIFLIAAGSSALCQSNASGNAAETVAAKIADKLKDSLGLSTAQRNSVYAINMQLHQRKIVARQSHTNRDLQTDAIQQAEKTRDSLYRAVLPEQKYLLYKQKRPFLISID